jgi:hypothetical protein
MFFLRPEKKVLILLLVFFSSLFSTLSPLFAKGVQEDAFEKIDRLVAEKKYDEAIKLLTDIARDDPALFDKAQQRLRAILQTTNRYTEIATQLLDTIERDAENTSRIYELSEELDSLGEARTDEARALIREIQETARYRVYLNQLEDILARGRLLIDSGDYGGAYNLYLSGFSLFAAAFAESDYSGEIKSRMAATQQTIQATEASFAQHAQNIQPIAAEISALQTADGTPREHLAAVTQTFDRIRENINGLIQMKNLVWDVRDDYRQYLEIENTSEGRHYVTFGNILINGRSGQDVHEGLLGAIDGLWRSVVGQLQTITDAAADAAFRDIFNALSAHNYALARDLVAQTIQAVRGPADILAALIPFTARDAAGGYTVFGRTVRGEDMDYALVTEALSRVLPLLAQAAGYDEAYARIDRSASSSTVIEEYRSASITAAQAIQREQGIRASIDNLRTSITNLIGAFETNLGEILPIQPFYQGANRGAGYFSDGLVFVRSLETGVAAVRLNQAVRQFTIENEEYAKNYPQRLAALESNTTIMTGVSKTLDEGQTYISRDPLTAAGGIDTLAAALASDIANGRALLNRYTAENPAIQNAAQMSALRAEAEKQLALYETLRGRGVTTGGTARRSVSTAEALREEGGRFFQQARQALTQNEFDTARTYLRMSDDRYATSLDTQDSASLRRERREYSQALSGEIARLEREFILREVEDLVGRAQPEFYADNFETAEQLLVRAQTRYATISKEDHPDVRYWLTIVRNALSLRSGRTIPFTAPLYPEMSQLLSSAELEYREGIALLRERRDEAIGYFTAARQKTQEVKLLFPLNQTAALLELRMDQVVDPEAFNASFSQRLETAVSGTKRSDIQSFADLQDLATINPNFRGMAQIVYQAEIDMGIRPPPPDEVAIARSRDLTRAAQNLIAGGVRSNLEIAQEQLNEALRVNPNNTTAQTELDRVQRLMGRRAASELESAVDGDYQEALRELLAGNKIIAYSIVRRVLSRPEYQNSSRFQELLQRIESVL